MSTWTWSNDVVTVTTNSQTRQLAGRNVNARHKDQALLQNTQSTATDSLKTMLQDIRPQLLWPQDLEAYSGWYWVELTTTVVLLLSDEVMTQYELQYFMSSRLSQDPVENLFSQARGHEIFEKTFSCIYSTNSYVPRSQEKMLSVWPN